MDRDSIQRRDFPTGRKGYDPGAVDEHLRRVADEFERSVAPQAKQSLSSGASEQVRLILEAAERGAADMRAKAGEEAGDHVARVRGAADGLLGRLDELERELGTLLDALRTSGERLNAGLADLQTRVADSAPAGKAEDPRGAAKPPEPAGNDPRGAATPPDGGDDPRLGAVDPRGAATPADRGGDDPRGAATPPDGGDDPRGAATPPDRGRDDPAPEPAPDALSPADLDAEIVASGADEAGARLIALNMALTGTPRDETARYLADHFALADLDGLLDDVYSRAGQ